MANQPRVLLAEDNRISQRIGEAMLISLGCLVDIRANGREAVEACLADAYDVVLMDGFMPEMDGFEAAREIRRLERGRRTPIIALTAGQWGASWNRCFDAGMDAYLQKPVSAERLAATLAEWLPQPGAETAFIAN